MVLKFEWLFWGGWAGRVWSGSDISWHIL